MIIALRFTQMVEKKSVLSELYFANNDLRILSAYWFFFYTFMTIFLQKQMNVF